MLWAAYIFSGIFVVLCVAVLCRELARRRGKPDWRVLDGLLKRIMGGK